MLAWRLGVSAVLIPGFALLFWLDARSGPTALPLLGLSLLLAARSAWELVKLLTLRAMSPSLPLSTAGCLFVVFSAWCAPFVEASGQSHASVPDGLAFVAGAFVLVFLGLLFAAALRYREPGRTMETLAAETFIVAYAGLLLAATAELRWAILPGSSAGYLALASVVIVAKSGDIGAYTLGRLFGKRKMAPRLSPGKTWAGAFGAVLFSGLAGWAWLTFAPRLFDDRLTPAAWPWTVLYGVVVGVAGLIGDLCESLVKRDVGQKDAPRLFPGFGGLLDLLDSILYAGPVALLLWRAMPLVGLSGE